jgi:predicted amidohydrolase YtcJ
MRPLGLLADAVPTRVFSWPPKQSLADELGALSVVFSRRDISRALGQGTARSTLKQDQSGTLESCMLADLVLIDRNPLTDINDLLKVVTTIKGGVIGSGTRAARQ